MTHEPKSSESESRGDSPVEGAPPTPPIRRWILLGCGWVCVGLGLAGVPLPLLPTTPFLILAGACFARSSPRLNARLLAHPKLGPYLTEWQEQQSIPAEAKLKAYGIVLVSFSISIAWVGTLLARILLAVIGVALLAFLSRLKTTGENSGEDGGHRP